MTSKGLLGILSDETIFEIFEKLAPRERARFSALNKHMFYLLYPWSDINRITAYKIGIVLASDRRILEVHHSTAVANQTSTEQDFNFLARTLRSTPFIQKLVISSVEHICTLPATAFDCLTKLQELTLPCDTFDNGLKLSDKIKTLFSIKTLIVLRILKRFDTPRKAKNVIRAEHAQNLQAVSLKMLKLQGVSLTPKAMDVISKKYSNSLRFLCLMGTLAHTPDAANYLNALRNFKNLCKLTLPPSLLSLSSKPLYQECRLLSQLNVKYLCVYVYESEIIETRYFLKKLLPTTLKELCLHDPTHLVMRDLRNEEFRKLNFKVTFCKRMDTLYQQDWMHGHCELLSHMIWMQPYKHFNTEYPNLVPGWWYFMSENVDTAEENTEITATDASIVSQGQPAPAAQPQLPANEDPGEMMMATIARFFERMIDEQLNTEFGGNVFTDLPVTRNLPNNQIAATNNLATRNTIPQNRIDCSQFAVYPNFFIYITVPVMFSNHHITSLHVEPPIGQPIGTHPRTSFVVISSNRRGNSRIPGRVTLPPSAPPTHITPTAREMRQELPSVPTTTETTDSDDSDDSEDGNDSDSTHTGSSISPTPTTITGTRTSSGG
ncbi:unnamed protein product [Thelazia callipaeda]|uniref:F-box domain-containing protein n=1 Tax=Thelazia callipaeda TaxID=103827 RepID=A0A0N5CVD9_THECL|nr:unnamed protein product [Thelazia callipaeda]